LAFRLMENKRAPKRKGASIHSIEAPLFWLVFAGLPAPTLYRP
jgi:hypothetical protein